MEIKRIEEFEDKEGLKRKVIYKNGIVEISLLKPSQEYIRNEIGSRQLEIKKREEKEKREIKIREKMREIAIRELEKEKWIGKQKYQNKLVD